MAKYSMTIQIVTPSIYAFIKPIRSTTPSSYQGIYRYCQNKRHPKYEVVVIVSRSRIKQGCLSSDQSNTVVYHQAPNKPHSIVHDSAIVGAKQRGKSYYIDGSA